MRQEHSYIDVFIYSLLRTIVLFFVLGNTLVFFHRNTVVPPIIDKQFLSTTINNISDNAAHKHGTAEILISQANNIKENFMTLKCHYNSYANQVLHINVKENSCFLPLMNVVEFKESGEKEFTIIKKEECNSGLKLSNTLDLVMVYTDPQNKTSLPAVEVSYKMDVKFFTGTVNKYLLYAGTDIFVGLWGCTFCGKSTSIHGFATMFKNERDIFLTVGKKDEQDTCTLDKYKIHPSIPLTIFDTYGTADNFKENNHKSYLQSYCTGKIDDNYNFCSNCPNASCFEDRWDGVSHPKSRKNLDILIYFIKAEELTNTNKVWYKNDLALIHKNLPEITVITVVTHLGNYNETELLPYAGATSAIFFAYDYYGKDGKFINTKGGVQNGLHFDIVMKALEINHSKVKKVKKVSSSELLAMTFVDFQNSIVHYLNGYGLLFQLMLGLLVIVVCYRFDPLAVKAFNYLKDGFKSLIQLLKRRNNVSSSATSNREENTIVVE
ncbi:hypothetical protein ABK040_006220 [Willaertia magna]